MEKALNTYQHLILTSEVRNLDSTDGGEGSHRQWDWKALNLQLDQLNSEKYFARVAVIRHVYGGNEQNSAAST